MKTDKELIYDWVQSGIGEYSMDYAKDWKEAKEILDKLNWE